MSKTHSNASKKSLELCTALHEVFIGLYETLANALNDLFGHSEKGREVEASAAHVFRVRQRDCWTCRGTVKGLEVEREKVVACFVPLIG